MNIDKKYALEVDLMLDKQAEQIAALKLRCIKLENKIVSLESSLQVYTLTDASRPFSEIDMGQEIDELKDLLKKEVDDGR
jgi:hypothetical protein